MLARPPQLTNLTENERVEDQRTELIVLIDPNSVIGRVEAEDLVSSKVQSQSNHDLEQCLPENHHPHL